MDDDYRLTQDSAVMYVDTEKLQLYEDRVKQILTRAVSAEDMLEDLFKQVGHVGLINIAEMYLRDGNKSGLKKCLKYLNETAAAFIKAEAMLTNGL